MRRIIFIIISFFLSLATPFVAFAQLTYANPITYNNITTIPEFLLALVDLVFLIAVPLIVMCIIYSGFLFVTAGDNDNQVKKARFVFQWTVVGAMVLLSAKAIAAAVQATILSLS